jgi:type II secretion system protein G
MQIRSAARRSAQRGFTLVELMVVVAIIALIAGIIIPNYVHARRQASVSDTEANLKQIATALELYFTDNLVYPTGNQTTVDPQLFGGTNNSYLNSTPTDDVGRQAYLYTQNTQTGQPPSYLVQDPATYDPASLTNVSLGPAATGTQKVCGDVGNCTKVQYDPRYGIYGTAT